MISGYLVMVVTDDRLPLIINDRLILDENAPTWTNGVSDFRIGSCYDLNGELYAAIPSIEGTTLIDNALPNEPTDYLGYHFIEDIDDGVLPFLYSLGISPKETEEW